MSFAMSSIVTILFLLEAVLEILVVEGVTLDVRLGCLDGVLSTVLSGSGVTFSLLKEDSAGGLGEVCNSVVSLCLTGASFSGDGVGSTCLTGVSSSGDGEGSTCLTGASSS